MIGESIGKYVYLEADGHSRHVLVEGVREG